MFASIARTIPILVEKEWVSERKKNSLQFIIIILSVHVHNYAVEYALEKHISDVCPWNAINLLAARSSPM